jgi:(1->4)-alpha-D-glucan 1-alpha-D-glucosylmutase
VAFLRGGRALTVVTRLSHRLAVAGGWRDTELALPDGGWTDLLTRRTYSGKVGLAELLDHAPVALLTL